MDKAKEHLQQVKVEQPEEYQKIMQHHETEADLLQDVSELTRKALNYNKEHIVK